MLYLWAGVYIVLVGKPEGKIPLGRPWRRWEDNIKIDLGEVECAGMHWIDLVQDRDRWRALRMQIHNDTFMLHLFLFSKHAIKECFT